MRHLEEVVSLLAAWLGFALAAWVAVTEADWIAGR